MLAHRRHATGRLLRAVAALVERGKAGKLPTSAHWITESRLVFLRKKVSTTPRPIRVGELWRRVIAKRLVDASRSSLRERFVGARQCGVALPGGADVLVHARRCCEAVAADSEDAVVLLDLDLRNAFPSFEWSAVRDAVRRERPELDAWTSWTHQAPARVRLPAGEWTSCDRGAEQGDPLGPVYCGLVLLGIAETAATAVAHSGSWCTDWWYMDGGQVVLPPSAAKRYLSAFDQSLAAVGGSRLDGDELKSTARLCGTAEARAAALATWTEGVVETCRILTSSTPKVLGVG